MAVAFLGAALAAIFLVTGFLTGVGFFTSFLAGAFGFAAGLTAFLAGADFVGFLWRACAFTFCLLAIPSMYEYALKEVWRAGL